MQTWDDAVPFQKTADDNNDYQIEVGNHKPVPLGGVGLDGHNQDSVHAHSQWAGLLHGCTAEEGVDQTHDYDQRFAFQEAQVPQAGDCNLE